MSVISLASPKGGVGKTTTAVTLAGEFAQAGAHVTLIDADPNRPLERWSGRPGKPDNIEVVLDDDENTILDNIQRARQRSKIVIVDLESTANARVLYAVSQSHLVVIPCQGSKLDADEAAVAIKMIRAQERAFKRKIEYALLWSKIPVSYTTRNLRAIREQFKAHKIPLLSVPLYQRDAFVTMFDIGGTIHTLRPDQAPGLPRARANAHALAEAVVRRLRGQPPAETVATESAANV